MAIEVSDSHLETALCHPTSLYEALTSAKGYTPKAPACTGDCELVLTDLVARGRLICCTVVHGERKAYLSLLSADEAMEMRTRLEELTFGLNSLGLAKALTGGR